MSFWSKIFIPFFSTKKQVSPATTAADNIILFVDDLINRKDLASECVSLYENCKNKSDAEREKCLAKTYLCYEKFILENKPLIVKKNFDKNELRTEVIKKFKDSDIPSNIRFIFLPFESQIIEIFRMATSDFFAYAISNIGFEHIKDVFSNNIKDNVLFELLSLEKDGLVIKRTPEQNINKEEFFYLLRNLFSAIKKEIENKFGTKIAEELTDRSYSSFKEIYSFEFLQIFLQIVPEGLLEKEKIGILAREEIEHKLSELISEEKKKREDKEKLALELQKVVEELNENKAATLNLLEDVSREKDNIEKEVQRRTVQLREEKGRLRSSIESLPMPFFMIDLNYQFILTNEKFFEVFSLEKNINFKEFSEKISSVFDLENQFIKAINEGVYTKDKEVFWEGKYFTFSIIPVILVKEPGDNKEKDEDIGALFLANDITEQKVLARSKDEFFAIASHELRTPLTSIRGNSSMILEFFSSELKNKDIEQMLKDIHMASLRLIKIVNDFLDVSRLEQSKVVFKRETLDIVVALNEIYRDFLPIVGEKGLYLKIDKIPKDLFLTGDKERIKQVMINLISNAINYTKAGGVSLSLEVKDKKIEFMVSDTGVGIPEEGKILLFRKFQQANEKILTRDMTQSTGLGLYISKLLTESMGGSIELVESTVDKGSIFKLLLPVS